MAREWWQDAVFYQIYPRSFADANGDGIGDLDGITAHLDYLNDASAASLGIDAIWLSPINPSPLKDWGYDVSDYCDVHPDLGTLASFDRMLAEAHRRGIRIVLDLVPNHTSDRHPWFVESRSSRTNPKRDWYIWHQGRDANDSDVPPTNWKSTFGGSAWEFDAPSGEWYLHSFLREQPDLNFRNPEVVAAMHEVISFWLERGVDGFRVDVIAQMIKDAQFRDNPEVPAGQQLSQLERLAYEQRYSSDQPEVHDIVRGFRRVLDRYRDRMMVGEVWPRDPRSLADYLRPDELQQAFNFRFLFAPWSAEAFRTRIAEVESMLGDAWPTYTLSNHDFPRHLTRYGARDGEARARMAAVLLLTMRGTPFIYYSEEIGMPNVAIPEHRKRDPVGRDGCRTPMQWDAARGGGFTAASEPWLPLGDCAAVNVAKQLGDASSMLALYRRMIHLRKRSRALSEGSYRTEATAPADCLLFHREAGNQHVMVALNFGDAPHRLEVPRTSILLSTDCKRRDAVVSGSIELMSNEALVLEILR